MECEFESFGLHARLLYFFLQSDKDSRNVPARDFYDFQPEPAADISPTMDKFNGHLFHLGKRRSSAQRKIDIEDAGRIYQWLVKRMEKFIAGLPDPYKSAWNANSCDPIKVAEVAILVVENQTSTSHVGQVTNTVFKF